jgi:hypothetical protein
LNAHVPFTLGRFVQDYCVVDPGKLEKPVLVLLELRKQIDALDVPLTLTGRDLDFRLLGIDTYGGSLQVAPTILNAFDLLLGSCAGGPPCSGGHSGLCSRAFVTGHRFCEDCVVGTVM